jgi:EAL domain-containing protein (putative c-di-GMP-specific phosphodiesterase class I)/FixJ family two-component response regulator
MAPIRVLVADDDNSVVDVLRALIESEADLRFAGSANDAEGAIALAIEQQPDVALVDVRMPGGGGVTAARGITRRCPATKVIAVTAHEDDDTVIAMMGAGAHGYVCKGESTERILHEIYRRGGEGRDASDVPDRPAGTHAPGARRREQQRRIRELLESDSLSVSFEPVVAVDSGSIVGVEAITRVARLPVRALDWWLAEAEAAGMLLGFELASTQAALADLSLVPSDAFVSVKVSPTSVIEPELRELLLTGSASRIVLELTEQAPVHDYAAVNDALTTLRGAGVRLAVADVGGGVASLRHVAMLAPDFVTLDIALTDTVDADSTRHAIVAALTACASQLGARAVAANVRSFDQLEELVRLGVDLVQGPLVAELRESILGRTGS